MNDPYNLQRFVDAQKDEFEEACAQLRNGDKTGHWMWFIFPQIKGLGSSYNAAFFGIFSLKEAEAYLKHPILGPRLVECTRLVTLVEGRSAEHIFGHLDCLKFRSCITLFSHATSDNQVFKDALKKYFQGKSDPLTLNRLGLPTGI